MAATLEDIINTAIEDTDRPDMLRVCRIRARDILFSGHALADFHRDIKQTEKEVGEERTIIALPSNFRKERNIVAYDEDDNELPYIYSRKSPQPFIDSYGFVDNGFKYYLAGGLLHVQHYADSIPDKVAMVYYAMPTFAVDGESQEVSTDSWLVQQESYLLAAFIQLIYKKTGSSLVQIAAADYQAAITSLVASELEF